MHKSPKIRYPFATHRVVGRTWPEEAHRQQRQAYDRKQQDQKLINFASTCFGKTTSSCLVKWYDLNQSKIIGKLLLGFTK